MHCRQACLRCVNYCSYPTWHSHKNPSKGFEGIQEALQRVCHRLVRHKTTPLKEARKPSASNRRPELHNAANFSKYAGSETKMPITFVGGVSALEAAGATSTAPDAFTATRRASAGDDGTADVTSGRQANKKKFAAVLPASPTTTPTKKSPSPKKMGTAEDYHTVLLNNRSVVVPIIEERLYLARLQDVPVPRVSDVAVFFSTDEEFMYENFFDDFGPLNIGNVYRYCKKIEKKMRLSGSRGRKLVHVGYSADNRLCANAAWLIGSYCIVVEKMLPDVVYERVSSLLNQSDLRTFPAFRDAAMGPSSYDLSLLDCFRALTKALRYGFFNYETFNIDEYEHYEKVENGDFNWISSKFLAFCGPSATSRLDNGYPLHAPDVYFTYFRKHNVTTIIRLNAPQYPAKRFIDAGFEHHDLIYPDGTSPPIAIMNRFLRICENARGAIAVHCKAGLGRTGTLIGAYLMKHYRLTTAEAIAWLRIARPGSVIGQQQHFLEGVKESLWKQGDQCRRELAASAIATSTTTDAVGAGGDAGLTKAETASSGELTSQASQKQNLETGLRTPPVESNGEMHATSTPPNASKAAISSALVDVITDTNIGTPGKEARVRRQNTSVGNNAQVADNGGAQLKARQSIRRAQPQQHSGGDAAQNSSAGNDNIVSANDSNKTASNSSPAAVGAPMATRRSAHRSLPESEQAAIAPLPTTTTTVSNKRKRLFATTNAIERSADKATAPNEQIVTEEDVEGLISHAETVDEMAAATAAEGATTAGRVRKVTPTKNSNADGGKNDADDAIQPTQTAAEENSQKEEVRNERLMELFRANRLDKVATIVNSSESSIGENVSDVEASANCHLISDTLHLTQGDMLNMAKAKRSVYPFGFGRGAGHGSPSSTSSTTKNTDVSARAAFNDSADRKAGLRSSAHRDRPAQNTSAAQGRPTAPLESSSSARNDATPQQLGRTRRQSRTSATTGSGDKATAGSVTGVTPQRSSRGPTPPMPTASARNRQDNTAASSSATPQHIRSTRGSAKPATTASAKKAVHNLDHSAKISGSTGKTRRSSIEQKTSPSPLSPTSYALRSKSGRASNT